MKPSATAGRLKDDGEKHDILDLVMWQRQNLAGILTIYGPHVAAEAIMLTYQQQSLNTSHLPLLFQISYLHQKGNQ